MEGFIEAYKKKDKGKLQGTNRQVDGIRFQKPKVSYYYRPITKPKNGVASSQPSVQSDTGSPTVNVGSACNEPTTDPISSTAPPRDDLGRNNNWVEDINIVDLKNSFDVLKDKDSVLEPVIGTASPEVISSSLAQSGCTNVLIGMSSCLKYVTGSSKTPTSSCCSSLANVVQSQPQCLCSALDGSALAGLGIRIDKTAALALPGACNVKTPPVSRCNGGGSAPMMAPARSPQSSDVESSNGPSPSSISHTACIAVWVL
ncbi:plant lipid transfer protein/Par allergen [Artemisia annua]|uniref:Plant lipid transfer protein/Par allergen n=1 Tax=Artemisia annua TaxID=35608 RepID=A0A2U1NWF3_ARTAN|nr:plant lipid transfer protein/Par allergen [Artemisia annua]